MHLLFYHCNNNADEDVDITLTDDTEAMSTPHQISEEVNADKCLKI